MVCLETSFLIDLVRGNKDANEFLSELLKNKEIITIAAPSLMELIGSASLNKIKREKEDLLDKISGITILPLDKKSSILAGEIDAYLIMAGETIGSIDIAIGAIAKLNNESLVTRNKKHFARIPGLKIRSY